MYMLSCRNQPIVCLKTFVHVERNDTINVHSLVEVSNIVINVTL